MKRKVDIVVEVICPECSHNDYEYDDNYECEDDFLHLGWET